MSAPHTLKRMHSAENSTKYDSIITADPDILPSDIRHRRLTQSDTHLKEEQEGQENGFVMMPPENAIEAHRMVNNYKFGFKKWKSHVTSRPLSERSEVVQDLYADISELKPVIVSTIRPTNILYVLFLGWWMALIYLLLAVLMLITILGYSYAPYCLKLAKYFLWPFGKFVYQIHSHNAKLPESQKYHSATEQMSEETSLLKVTVADSRNVKSRHPCKGFWKSPKSYVWLLIGCPILLIVHGVVSFLSWMLVVTIPTAKVNIKTILQILWMPPDELAIGDSSSMTLDPKRHRHEIIMYTHQSVNFYYYKYTVDGMNVILVNLLVFVVLSLIIGYTDEENKQTSGVTKCILAVLAIVPLTYYIGMGIISISAQSSFAVGAVLNATFGSGVELILYVVAMLKGAQTDTLCYNELVRSALTGTLVGSILFIPGLCMIVGGIKYRSQRFNPKSANVTAIFLFAAMAGVFSPTLFSKVFGDLSCQKCELNVTNPMNVSNGFQCTGCKQSVFGLDGDRSLYDKHIQPLVYGCGLILPVIYIIGVVFTLKTHSSYMYDEFYEQLRDDCNGHEHEGAPQWSRIKSVLILLGSAILIAFCADLITNNIEALLKASGVSEYFIGVTMIAMIPELPEIINGVQFALQNNVNLGIEIGTNTAIQVCLIQVPVLILINLIYPNFNFLLVFNDVHLFAVIFSVIVINYVFQDGKSDYFQGSALVGIYLILLVMYFFVPTPDSAKC